MARVAVHNVSKRFTLRRDRADSVGQLLVRMLPGRKAPPSEPFWALRDVSFEMGHGRSLGVIGHNGAGKSTLLKILTRTMLPTTGMVRVEGRTSALIELGAGFHPDFTGRENIVLNASILGISRREIERKMSDIIDFSGIAPFIDTPVKYYSSGMHARLGFSVAIHVEPELLIVDEVLAVGDQAFSEQCMNRIFQMKKNGVSILLVTHSLDAVETLMDEAVWIDHGTVMATGAPRAVVHAYRRHVAEHDTTEGDGAPLVPVGEQGARLRLLDCRVVGDDGRETIEAGRSATISMHLDGLESLRIHMRLLIQRQDGLTIAEFSTRHAGSPLDISAGRHEVRVRIEMLSLVPGTFDVSVSLSDEGGTTLVEDQIIGQLTVWSNSNHMGICVLQHDWSVD